MQNVQTVQMTVLFPHRPKVDGRPNGQIIMLKELRNIPLCSNSIIFNGGWVNCSGNTCLIDYFIKKIGINYLVILVWTLCTKVVRSTIIYF